MDDIEKMLALKDDIGKAARTVLSPTATEKFAKSDPRLAWARREQDEKISALHRAEKALRGIG